MSAHTPGPWRVYCGEVFADENAIPIASMIRDTVLTRPTERDANARLCAAAPELLGALEALLEDPDSEDHRDRASRIVRRAKGERP